MTAKTDKSDTRSLFPCICDETGVWGESVKTGQTENVTAKGWTQRAELWMIIV